MTLSSLTRPTPTGDQLDQAANLLARLARIPELRGCDLLLDLNTLDSHGVACADTYGEAALRVPVPHPGESDAEGFATVCEFPILSALQERWQVGSEHVIRFEDVEVAVKGEAS